jgi:DNA polymerase
MTVPYRNPGAHFFDSHKGIVGLDIETTSAADLKDCGAWAYARHPSTRVLVVSWCYAEGPGLGPVYRWYPGDKLPQALVEYLVAGGSVLAHNAAFEVAIWSNILTPCLDWPPVTRDQWRDSQAVGCEMNLPSSLGGLASVLGTLVQKDAKGKSLMMRLAKAKVVDGEVVYPPCSAEDLERLSVYCDDDVLAMMHAWHRMVPLSVVEERTWRHDQVVNARGVYLDAAYAAKLLVVAEERTKELARRTQRDSGYALSNSVEPLALKKWLKDRGIALPKVTRKNSKGLFVRTESTNKESLGVMLDGDGLDPLARRVLENRLEATKATSLRKLRRVPLMVGGDGRLRNALKYCAAGTGRWSSGGLQIHNLPKDKATAEQAKLVDLLVDRGDTAALAMIEERPLSALSQKLRSVIAAAPGRELIAADFASVEACVCAWLAGEEGKVDFLHNYFRELASYRRGDRPDKPQDLYEFAAASMASGERQLGKVAELALQYGMGDFTFARTATNWGVPLTPVEAGKIKRKWRASNPKIRRFWALAEVAAMDAVDHRGESFSVGYLRFVCDDRCLFMALPSGRALRYWKPRIVDHGPKRVRYFNADNELVEMEIEKPTLQFWKANNSESGMALEDTYGGKLVENATQAVARDLLAEALLRLEAVGYPIVMHVHDSAAAEVPTGTGSVEQFCDVMQEAPAWAHGCPIAADGYRARRFKG